jgi:hypothetical protein
MMNSRWWARRLPSVTLAAAAVLAGGWACLPGIQQARAATFGALSGTLTIRAGDDPQQTTPAILGSTSLGDSDFNGTTGGIYTASAGLTISRIGGSTLLFSGIAAASTNEDAMPPNPNAIAFVNFSQAFTTATPQWIEFTTKVKDTGAEVSAVITLNRTGEAMPLFTQSDTAEATITQRGLFAPGTFSAQGFISATANFTGAHSGVIDGSILIASLADFNNDGVVSSADLPTIRSNFGSTTGLFANGDLDANGRTDGSDLLLWQRQLGTHTLAAPAATAIPEPATGGAAVLGVLALSNYYRMRRSAARRASPSPAR